MASPAGFERLNSHATADERVAYTCQEMDIQVLYQRAFW